MQVMLKEEINQLKTNPNQNNQQLRIRMLRVEILLQIIIIMMKRRMERAMLVVKVVVAHH